jgi:hypothetical protein
MAHRARELILHIGVAKTGTSAIQRALVQNRGVLLRDYGILYPGNEESHLMLQACFSLDPMGVAVMQQMGFPDRDRALTHLRHWRRGIAGEVQDKRPRRIILSSEYLTALSTTELRRLRRFLMPLATTVKVVAYVRDPWSHAISALQEFVRSGLVSGTLEIGYVRSNVEILEKFEEVFGQVTVIPYVRAGGDVVADFLGRLGIETDRLDISSTQDVNRAMKREAVIALLQLNRRFPTFDAAGRFIADPARDWMIECLRDNPLASTPIHMSRTTAQRILAESGDDLDALQFRYLGGNPVLRDQYDVLTTTEENDILSPASQDPEQVYDFMIAAMRQLAIRAAEQFVDRVYWTGMYYRANGNRVAAADCFRQVLSFSPINTRSDDAKAQLASLANEAAAVPAPGNG